MVISAGEEEEAEDKQAPYYGTDSTDAELPEDASHSPPVSA